MSETLAKSYKSTVIPALRYRDAHAAIAWLVRVFGFKAEAVFDGPDNTVAHAQLVLGNGMIMLGSASNQGEMAKFMVEPGEIGIRSTASIYLVVEDAAVVYENAKAAGAKIVEELREMDYGGKAFNCLDLEGHFWSIGEYDPWAPS
jgi:uncharacterized glyoxalase superfamily protein PhnB